MEEAESIKPQPAVPGFGANHFPFTIEHRLAPFMSYAEICALLQK
ncbi:hypothetical protein [Klebsiella michiganensis]|nr:hypothetical protein [Klebsiella michiganensis]